MEIIETDYLWHGTLQPFPREVKYIVLHHAAAHGSAEAIHLYHRDTMGWAGIAYHLYVRANGTVWRGRPMDRVGAHVGSLNDCSVGICFEGNFCEEQMGEKQLRAGREAIAYARGIYPGAQVVRHSDLNATACPGTNFPFGKLLEEKMTGEEIYKALAQYMSSRPLPDWAAEEWAEAAAAGITDGTDPMGLIPRCQGAIMALRAMKKGKEN